MKWLKQLFRKKINYERYNNISVDLIADSCTKLIEYETLHNWIASKKRLNYHYNKLEREVTDQISFDERENEIIMVELK